MKVRNTFGNTRISVKKQLFYGIICNDKKTKNQHKGAAFFMLRIENGKQLNIHSQLYQNIPENHILKLIDSAISFEFVNELLADNYSKNLGRPAKEPELVIKIMLIQKLYRLSNDTVMKEIAVNLAFMWYIGINPGDPIPDKSLIPKFIKLRLKGMTLDDILTEVVRQCYEKGIIEPGNESIIDAMHIHANTTKKFPERVMKHLVKKIFKAVDDTESVIPDYTQIDDHKEAKQVMKEYLEAVMESADERAEKEVELAREVLASPLFIEQKGIRSLVDMDARVGYKTKTDSFFGYKMEYMMSTNGLITAVGVHDGAYVDGTDFDKLYELTLKCGVDVKALFGDKAYFKKAILNKLSEDGAKAYIPVSHSTYRVDETLYSYNKDIDQWICVRGNRTAAKKTNTSKRKDGSINTYYEYTFEKEECEGCPLRGECIKKAKGKAKKLGVGTNAAEYFEHSQWAKTDAFIEEYKKRAPIEGKNGEMKCFHGLDRAIGFGLESVNVQAKLTAIAVNLKKVASVIAAKDTEPILDSPGIPVPEAQKVEEMQVVDAPVSVDCTLYFVFITEFVFIFSESQKNRTAVL